MKTTIKLALAAAVAVVMLIASPAQAEWCAAGGEVTGTISQVCNHASTVVCGVYDKATGNTGSCLE